MASPLSNEIYPNLPSLDAWPMDLWRLVIDALDGGRRGRLGSSMSPVEILRVLYDDVVRRRPAEPMWDGLATKPVEVLDDVARWLGTEQHPPMSVAIARERVPRVIDKKGLQKRLKTCAPRLTRFILKRWLSVVRNMSRNGDLKVPLAD